jgi:hypothetical protein
VRDTLRPSEELLVRLVYELLDAHHDTATLAAELHDDVRWRAHVDYLRALQHIGRSILATSYVGSLV